MTDIQVYDFLEQSGVRGMRWGVRKSKDTSNSSKQTESKSHTKRNVAIVLGSAAVIAAVTVGAVYAKKHMGVKTSDISKVPEAAKKLASSLSKEPTGIIHATRGKNIGFTFPQHGGLDDPLVEHAKSGLAKSTGDFFTRYGDRNEKVAARFLDPLGRKDFAGRDIFHEVMLPESLTAGITKHEDVVPKVWPMIKDTYSALYDKAR